MIICDEKKFIFIHVPKTSGTAMSNTIIKKYPNSEQLSNVEKSGENKGIDKMHLYNEVISKYIDEYKLSNYIKFCIVRNPYDKLYSAWNYLKDRYQYKNVNEFVKHELCETFIYGKEMKELDARVHYRPQFTFIYNNNQDKYVDNILKYENLNKDISNLNKQYNLNILEYGKNQNEKSYIKHFNKESINKINNLYRKDFMLLQYDMITPLKL